MKKGQPTSLVNAYAELKGKEDLRSLMKKSKEQRAPMKPPQAQAQAQAPRTAGSAAPSPMAHPGRKSDDNLKRKAPAMTGLVSYDDDDAGDGDEDNGDAPPDKKLKQSGDLPQGLPTGFFDSDSSKPTPSSSSSSSAPATSSGLPEGFFDDPNSAPTTTAQSTVATTSSPATAAVGEQPEQPKSSIPKGFFDDKKKDSEVRQAKDVDELGEEWAKFQKEIHKEEQASTAVRDEDLTELLLERDQREISEMEELWTTVERLERQRANLEKLKQEKLAQKSQEKKPVAEESDEDDDDEEIVDDFMNWRAKATTAKPAQNKK